MTVPVWRARMFPKVARSEVLLMRAFSRAGLSEGMTTQDPIPLVNDCGEEFATIPDFTFHCDRCDKVLFLDGPSHLKRRVEERDETITRLLEAKGYRVKRIPYDGHILKPVEVLRIVNEVHAWLGVE